MQPFEREMFLYPRVCAGCHLDEGSRLNECPECFSVSYCCEEHKPKNHSVWCKDLRVLLDLNVEQSKMGRIECMLPHQLLERFEEFPASLKVTFFSWIYKQNLPLSESQGISRDENDRCYRRNVHGAEFSDSSNGIRFLSAYNSVESTGNSKGSSRNSTAGWTEISRRAHCRSRTSFRM